MISFRASASAVSSGPKLCTRWKAIMRCKTNGRISTPSCIAVIVAIASHYSRLVLCLLSSAQHDAKKKLSLCRVKSSILPCKVIAFALKSGCISFRLRHSSAMNGVRLILKRASTQELAQQRCGRNIVVANGAQIVQKLL